MRVIGVDAGGTSTRAVLATSEGTVLGFGRGGRGNPTSSGVTQALAGVLDAVEAALAHADTGLGDVAAIVIAMAGHAAHGEGSSWIWDPLSERDFHGELVFESDLLAMYASGAVAAEGAGVGYGVVCGTGASAVRVEDGRVVATADGLGWLLGDRGSGFWIGRRAAHAAVDQLEGIGPETALTPLVLQAAGVPTAGATDRGADGRPVGLARLVRALYSRLPVQLAALAPLVFDAAEAGDPVAAGILERAGALLVQTVELVRTSPGPIVAGGSILHRPGPPQRLLRERFAAGSGHPVVFVDSGAVGATMLALRHGGAHVDEGLLARLRAGVPA